jgi:hypothetical protein
MPEPELTLEEAKALIEEEWEADRQQALNYRARKLIEQRAKQHDLVRREEQRRKAVAAEREQTEREARKAWRKVYGRGIAKLLEPWTAYTVVEVDGKAFAASPDRVAAVRAASRDRRGIRAGDVVTDVQGFELTKQVRNLDAVDPSDEELAEIVAARTKREREEQRRAATQQERERQEERERRRFGVTVSDVADAD